MTKSKIISEGSTGLLTCVQYILCTGQKTCATLVALALTTHVFAQSVHTYSISSYGVTGGTLTASEDTAADGTITRTVRVKNHAWASVFYNVDTMLRCVQEHTPTGTVHTVTKKVAEKDFAQNDVLRLYSFKGSGGVPASVRGWGHWTDYQNNTSTTFDIAPDALDMVCFFFNLRHHILEKTDTEDDHLIMDGASHAVAITAGKPRMKKTDFGKIKVVPINIVSKSPTLFVRNKPKNILVTTTTPTVLSVDVSYSVGTATATLTSWTTNTIPVNLKSTFGH